MLAPTPEVDLKSHFLRAPEEAGRRVYPLSRRSATGPSSRLMPHSASTNVELLRA